jgi:hypothetical protein
MTTFAKVIGVVVWRVKMDKIAITTCVNKNKPALKCKGKCQLMKMNQNDDVADTNNQSALPVLKSVFEFQPFFKQENEGTFIGFQFITDEILNNFFINFPKVSGATLTLIKPPQIIS